MFGYVMPVKCELKVREFDAYRSVYCGLCKQLQRSYGPFSRLFLNYDMVLLALVADAVSGDAGDTTLEGCIINPFVKRCICRNTAGLELAADALVMLTYHKLCDNVLDEKFPKSVFYRLIRFMMRGSYKKASAKHPGIAGVVSAQMGRQSILEKQGCKSMDEACEPTAKMCEALFTAAGRNADEQRILARLGLFSGQIVYLLDAAEDYEDDQKNSRYNVLINIGFDGMQSAVQAVQRRCRMAAGEIALCYNLLGLEQHKDILDNIFFLGLPAGISSAGIKRTKRGTGHG